MFDKYSIEILNKISLFFKLFNNMTDLVFLTKVSDGNQFSYVLANEPAMDVCGLTTESFGKPLNEVLPNELYKVIEAKYHEAMNKKQPITYEDQILVPPLANNRSSKYEVNQIVYWESMITPVFNQNGVCTHMLAIVRDITDRKRKEMELKQAIDRFGLVWNNVADAMYIFDKNEHFVSVNKSFEKLLGWTEEEIVNNPSISIIPNDSKEDLKAIIEKVKKGRVIPSHETQRVTRTGKIIDVLASYSSMYDSDGNWDGGIAVYKDISERKQYEEELKTLALHDSLTGLFNRRAFFKKLTTEMERARESNHTLSVLILDLDHFKTVNDTMGHDVGDKLLKEFAKRVKSTIREKDILARIGGDEFVILMPILNHKGEAVKIASRILQSFQKDWSFGNFNLEISASIGISFYSDYDESEKNLLKKADLALYRAKEKGRSNYQLYQD